MKHHLFNCGRKTCNDEKSPHLSTQLAKGNPEKRGQNGILSHELCDTGAMLYKSENNNISVRYEINSEN